MQYVVLVELVLVLAMLVWRRRCERTAASRLSELMKRYYTPMLLKEFQRQSAIMMYFRMKVQE